MNPVRWLLALLTLAAATGATHAMTPALTALALPSLFAQDTSPDSTLQFAAFPLAAEPGADDEDAPRPIQTITEQREPAPRADMGWVCELVKEGEEVCRTLLNAGRYEEARALAQKLQLLV